MALKHCLSSADAAIPLVDAFENRSVRQVVLQHHAVEMWRSVLTSLFYEDVAIGQRFFVTGRTITEMDVNLFGMISGDMHPIHTNAVYAAKTEFGQRITHGPLGIALAAGLFGRIPEFIDTAIAMTDIREWKFIAPVFLGDSLNLQMEIIAKRITRSGRGVIDREMQLVRQDGAIVQSGVMGLLIARR